VARQVADPSRNSVEWLAASKRPTREGVGERAKLVAEQGAPMSCRHRRAVHAHHLRRRRGLIS
jgi:hypothetical protein